MTNNNPFCVFLELSYVSGTILPTAVSLSSMRKLCPDFEDVRFGDKLIQKIDLKGFRD